MLRALTRPGIWTFAGLSGVRVGLDLDAALASLPEQAGLDRDFARELLLAAEAPFLVALHAQNKTDETK